MLTLIIGGGKVGSFLAGELVAEGREVVLLEKNPEIVEKIKDASGAAVVRADGCDPLKLEEAGIGRAELVVAATGDDEDNLVVSQLAKESYKVKRVIARVNNPRNKWLFDKTWGVDVAVSPIHIIAKVIKAEVVPK